jgi:hypothetical protein
MEQLLHHPTRVAMALAGVISAMVARFVFDAPIMMILGVLFILQFLTSRSKFLIWTGVGLLSAYFLLDLADTTLIRVDNSDLRNVFVYGGLLLMSLSILHSWIFRSTSLNHKKGEQDVHDNTH